MMKRFRDVSEVEVVGWSAKRNGLPYITAAGTPDNIIQRLAAAIRAPCVLLDPQRTL